MFLDGTYFRGTLALPNLKSSGEPVGLGRVLQTIQENTLEWFIARYEREALERILSPTLAANFIEGMSQMKVDERWQRLYDAIYSNSCCMRLSPTANYVYYRIQRDSVSKTAMIGEVRPRADKATNVSPNQKMVDAWNDMCRQVDGIRRFLYMNWEDYAGYTDDGDYFDNAISTPINVFGI